MLARARIAPIFSAQRVAGLRNARRIGDPA